MFVNPPHEVIRHPRIQDRMNFIRQDVYIVVFIHLVRILTPRLLRFARNDGWAQFVTAPTEAEETSLAYLAMTPEV